MATQVKLFHAPITDEYGGFFPEAYIAVRMGAYTSTTAFASEDCEGNYDIKSTIETLPFKVNYWYSQQTKADGKPSRPLVVNVAGEFTNSLKVDLENTESKGIIATVDDPMDKALSLIVAEITRLSK